MPSGWSIPPEWELFARIAAVQCGIASAPRAPPAGRRAGAVRVGRETKGRAGKGVTTVTGLPLSASDLAALAAGLKKRCGSGGTVREGVIEIQGDHRDTIVAELSKLGWAAKKSGG